MIKNISAYFPENINVWKNFLKITLPIILSSLMVAINGVIDNIMAGNISDSKTGNSVNISGIFIYNNISFIFIGLINAFNEIIGVFVAQYIAKDNKDKINKLVKLKFIINIFEGFLFFLIIFIFYPQIASLFTNNRNQIKTSFRYAKIVCTIFILSSFSFPFMTTFNDLGKTKYTLFISIFAISVNVFANILFVNFIQKDVTSLALATVFSKFVEIIVVLIIVLKNFRYFIYKFWNFSKIASLFTKIVLKRTLFLFMRFSMNIMVISRQAIFNWGYSEPGNSAPEIISSTGGIQNIFLTLGQGSIGIINVFVGSNLGLGKKEEAEKYAKQAIGFMLTMSLISSLMLMSTSFTYKYWSFINIPTILKQRGTEIIQITAFIAPIWVMMDVFISILKSGAKTRLFSIFTLITTAFQVLWAIIFVVLHINFGIIESFTLFYFIFFLSEYIRMLTFYLLYKKVDWSKTIT